MASLRTAGMLRHFTHPCSQIRTLRASGQRRWAQVHDVRFLATTQQPRSVIEKYRQKLESKAREEGLPDIDALKQAYKDKIERLRKETDDATKLPGAPVPAAPAAAAADAGAAKSNATTTTSTTEAAPKTPKKAGSSGSGSGIKPLSEILDMDKARELPIKELSAIWRLRYANNTHSLCAVIPSETYSAMDTLARSRPQFVLPVPHPEQGAEIHFLQWTWDAATATSTVLFTHLAEYKNRGEFAQPHTTVTHYMDFSADKGVVLMQGQVMEDRGVSPENAQWLLMCLQRFYGGWDGTGGEQGQQRANERRNLLDWFARGDQRFSVEKLMEEAERMG
ncbi:ATP11 protein-domain-containing protein [Sordaria brevicollis]|uniref:ATP11 protein-domain-containing protein n=1 Tax=Sordaria brevicollis TaxID=83679 RepID=A0AAE0PDL6_SORBR|nr:ATP11 protein-domain-containing protein [Sordaria brevicollis]